MKTKLQRLYESNKDLLTDYQIMSFGKYEGIRMRNVPDEYLLWLLKSPSLDLNWRDAIEIEMENRKEKGVLASKIPPHVL